MTDPTPFATVDLGHIPGGAPDAIAPDGSEIRFLLRLSGGSMVHCTLPPGATSLAVAHRTVQELWYVIAGAGELWRSQAGRETVEAMTAGAAFSIPLGTHFQFRNAGPAPLRFVIVTMPPWPGEDEATRVADRWNVTQSWKKVD